MFLCDERNIERVAWSTLALLFTVAVVGCSESGSHTNESSNTVVSGDEEAAASYREKVKQRVSASVVSSFSREWGVTESRVACVLADLNVTQLDDADTDATVAAVFDRCGVDPAAVK